MTEDNTELSAKLAISLAFGYLSQQGGIYLWKRRHTKVTNGLKSGGKKKELGKRALRGVFKELDLRNDCIRGVRAW